MFRRSARLAVSLAACAAAVSTAGVAHALPPTELLGDGGPVIPLKNAAMLVRTDVGYRYIAGQQDSRLTVTVVGGKLLYADTGTAELRDIPASCTRRSVATGIAALCSIPAEFGGANKMFLEVWPRLGDDFVDGSSLSASFRLWVLADAGNDTVHAGAGDDFVNGAQDVDTVTGGAGTDWIRTGIGADELWGGDGNDKLVGLADNDVIHGGAGNDRVACGLGRDAAYVDGSDRPSDCESVARS